VGDAFVPVSRHVFHASAVRLRAPPDGYATRMARKQEDEKQRQKRVREAKAQGKSASEVGATQGSDKQRDEQPRGSHPEQKTTHPVR